MAQKLIQTKQIIDAYVLNTGDTMTGNLTIDTADLIIDSGNGIFENSEAQFTNAAGTANVLVLNSNRGDASTGPDIQGFGDIVISTGGSMHLNVDDINTNDGVLSFRHGTDTNLATQFTRWDPHADGSTVGQQWQSWSTVRGFRFGPVTQGSQMYSGDPYWDAGEPTSSFVLSLVATGGDTGGLHISAGDTNNDEKAIACINFNDDLAFEVKATTGQVIAGIETAAGGSTWSIDASSFRVINVADPTSGKDATNWDSVFGNTWENIGRSTNTPYTNTFDYPIYISVRISNVGRTDHQFQVDGFTVAEVESVSEGCCGAPAAGWVDQWLGGIVPAGSTYEVVVGVPIGGEILNWYRLRR